MRKRADLLLYSRIVQDLFSFRIRINPDLCRFLFFSFRFLDNIGKREMRQLIADRVDKVIDSGVDNLHMLSLLFSVPILSQKAL